MNSRARADGDAVRTHAIQKYTQTLLSEFFMLPSGFESDLCAFPPVRHSDLQRYFRRYCLERTFPILKFKE